jgi:hypothetical protein
MKSKESNELGSNTEGGMLIPGEPDAVKVASPVRRGEWRTTCFALGKPEPLVRCNALCSYSTHQCSAPRPLMRQTV